MLRQNAREVPMHDAIHGQIGCLAGLHPPVEQPAPSGLLLELPVWRLRVPRYTLAPWKYYVWRCGLGGANWLHSSFPYIGREPGRDQQRTDKWQFVAAAHKRRH